MYCIERVVGDISDKDITKQNLFIEELDDMESLEFWEERLEYLKQSYITVYQVKRSGIVYSVFSKSKSKGSKFKV